MFACRCTPLLCSEKEEEGGAHGLSFIVRSLRACAGALWLAVRRPMLDMDEVGHLALGHFCRFF